MTRIKLPHLLERDTSARTLRGMDIVARYTFLAAASTRLPYWWATSPSVTGVQLKMLAEVSDVYDVTFEQDLARPVIASIGGGLLNLLVSENPITLAMKAWIVTVPVVGLPLRFGAGPAAVGAYTYVLGRAFVRHYDTGGSYHDFTADMFRAEAYRLVGLPPAGLNARWPANAPFAVAGA